MRFELRLAILAAGLPLLAYTLWCRQVPPVDEALARIRENVGQFETSLPDFICNEKITSRLVVRGKISKETVTESIFTGAQQKSKSFTFVETREIATINGKKVRRGTPLKGPYVYLGGFSSLLVTTFGPKCTPYHNYKVTGMETVDGRTLLAVEFATKPGQTEIKQTFFRKQMLYYTSDVRSEKDTGKAWIDPESMQVVRLERHYLNLPSTVRSLMVSTEYAKVTIDRKPYWMPKTVRAENVENRNSKPPANEFWIAEYSNYRKFAVSAGIRY